MTTLKRRVTRLFRRLIQEAEKLPDADLDDLGRELQQLYEDLYMLRAIQAARQSLSPGDLLAYEEALQFLEGMGFPVRLDPVTFASRTLDIRYGRIFLQELNRLDPVAYQGIYEFIFVKSLQLHQRREFPKLRSLGSSNIFFRFSLENYLIGMEVTGHLVKFLRILPKPEE